MPRSSANFFTSELLLFASFSQVSTTSSAKILYIKGRQHPVKIYHSSESQLDYTEAAMRTFFQIHTDQPPGDVLIFLPGQEDIESLQKSIQVFSQQLPVDKPAVSCIPSFLFEPVLIFRRYLHVQCLLPKRIRKIIKHSILRLQIRGNVYLPPTLLKRPLRYQGLNM